MNGCRNKLLLADGYVLTSFSHYEEIKSLKEMQISNKITIITKIIMIITIICLLCMHYSFIYGYILLQFCKMSAHLLKGR